MVFDYSKLLGRIKERGFTQESLAKQIKMSNSTLCLKLNNKANFRQMEIATICDALDIEPGNIGRYFFTLKVRKTEEE